MQLANMPHEHHATALGASDKPLPCHFPKADHAPESGYPNAQKFAEQPRKTACATMAIWFLLAAGLSWQREDPILAMWTNQFPPPSGRQQSNPDGE